MKRRQVPHRPPPRIPLGFVIAVPFVLLVAAAVGLTGRLSGIASRASADNLVRGLQELAENHIVQHLRLYLSTAHLINGLNTDAIRSGELDTADIAALARHFALQIGRFDSVVSICYAGENMDYVGPARDILGAPLALGISAESTGHALIAYRTDSQGALLEKLGEIAPGYDPRPRPWYRAAVEAKGPAWTPIFAWPTGDIGLDAVTPVHRGGKLVGVLDVSLTLGKIGEFLQTLHIAKGAKIFIVERSGLLVASSALKEPFVRQGNEVARLSAFDSGEPVVRAAMELLQKTYGDLGAVPGDIRIILDAPGGMQFMQTIAYRDGDGIDWLVISTIPETDFMSDITAGDRRTIVIVLGSVLLAVLLAAIAARWVTRPILQLNDAARMLAGGDFTGKAPIERRDEIGELARSFSSMAGQLRTSFSSLQESEERYRKLFDGLPIGLYRSTLVGVLLDANPAAVQILGFPDRETLLACDIQTLFVDPEDSAVWRERLKWEGIVKDYEVNIRRRDGRLIWVRTTCIVVRGSGGDVLSYEGSLEEVTERVRAEEALRESEEKFRILSEQSQIGICIVQDGTFAYVNPVFTTFTGFGSGDSVFKLGGWREGPAPDPRLIEALTTLFKQPDPFGTPRLTPSARLRTPSGEDRYFNVYLKAVHLGGKPAGMAALVDITEEKEAQAKAAERQGQLIRAEKLASLGVLAAGVAHEISNPNQAILLSGQVIRDAWLDVGSTLDEKAGEEGDFSIGGIPYSQAKEMIPNCLSAIMECSQRIETIVNDLKGFARQDQAGAFRPIDLNMVVKSSLTLCANMLKKSTDALTVRLAPDLPPVNGSYQRLEQVVINLVQNACQALPDSTRGIDICTRYDPVAREVVLEVSDQGVGIPSDDLSRIGDPFFTTKRETGGTGLGLSISTSIMQEHGGRLAYTSKPGEGTTAVVAIRRIE